MKRRREEERCSEPMGQFALRAVGVTVWVRFRREAAVGRAASGVPRISMVTSIGPRAFPLVLHVILVTHMSERQRSNAIQIRMFGASDLDFHISASYDVK